MDVALLKVEGAVFHQVPTKSDVLRSGTVPVPTRSEAESALDTRLEVFLRDRLTRTFKQAMQPVRRASDSTCITPDLVEVALRAQAQPDIVEPFHPLADLLLDVQAHNSPRGLLAVIRGSCGASPVVVLMKVEQERGLSFETRLVDGLTRVDVVIEDGLVLTDKTDVFKAALFYFEDDELRGYVTDDQSGSTFRGPSSRYWLFDFLGCEWANDVDVLTRSWIQGVQRFIKSDVKDPALKSSLTSALHAELASNKPTITPVTFMADHVPAELRDRAAGRLGDAGASNRRFQKSRSVAGAAPDRKRIAFDTGVVVFMPIGLEPEITQENNDGVVQDVLILRGKIKNVE